MKTQIEPRQALGIFVVLFVVATIVIVFIPRLGVGYGQTVTVTFKNTDGSPIVGAKCFCRGWDCECLPGYCEPGMQEQGYTDSSGRWKFKHLHAGGKVDAGCYCPGTSYPVYTKDAYSTSFTITGDCGIIATTTIEECTHNQLKCMNNKVYWCDHGSWKMTQDCRNYPGTTCSCKNGDCDCYHGTPPTCSDSDGGIEPDNKGVVTRDGVTKIDYCLSGNIFVREYYCDSYGLIEWVDKDCRHIGYGTGYCSGGRCVDGTPTTITPTTTPTTSPTTSPTTTPTTLPTTTISQDCTPGEIVYKTCEDGTKVEWCVCKGALPRWVCDEDWEEECPSGIPFEYIIAGVVLVIGVTYYYQKKKT